MGEEQQEQSAPAGAGASARDVLSDILRRMDIPADVVLAEDAERITLDIKTDQADRVVGRKGQVLEALQHLVTKMVYRGRGQGDEGPKSTALKPITVDADGYRERHIERLRQLAMRMAEKAIKSRQIVAMNPMSAHDRRIMHLALAEVAGVTTRSEGEGELRHLLIVPADQPAGETPSEP